METLTLNDGTVVAGHCFESSGKLFVYLDNMPMMEGILMFAEPERTKHIIAMNHGHERTYEGYTHLQNASDEYGNCNLVMGRNDNA